MSLALSAVRPTTQPDIKTLISMLEYRRPHGSRSESKFINRFLRPLGMQSDGYGNLYKRIGDAPRVMWCAHTDTVHSAQGKQDVILSACGDYLKLKTGDKSSCLGADNAAGVWLLVEMIKANRPGLYVFFRNEEHGRVGSEYFAANHADVFAGVALAIAFDRRGTGSVITHQYNGRCCSDDFAGQLADALGLGHKLDDGGVFTDTASFIGQISECTNVSVGYYNEHSYREILDWKYLCDLRDALMHLDASTLQASRDPSAADEHVPWWMRDEETVLGPVANRYKYDRTYDRSYDGDNDDDNLYYGKRSQTIEDIVQDYPLVIASILEEHGYTADSLSEAIMQITGSIRRK